MESNWAESRYTGPIAQLGPVPLRPHDPALAIWGGLLVPWGARSEALGVGGAGWDREAARNACLGEAIERWQPYPLPVDQVVEASFEAWPLGEPAAPPARWVLFTPDQYALPGFPFRPLTHQSVCRWVCCRQAPDGEPWWVPEDWVFLFARAGSHGFGPSTSTGLGCGRPGQPVLLRGVQEVIERDALMGAWWGRYPLVEWEQDRVLNELDPALPVRLLRPNLRYRFYRVDSPFSAHVTIVTLEGEDWEGFCFSAGSACRETRPASWLKSLLEAVQGRHYVRQLKTRPRGQGSDLAEPSPPTSFAEHAAYYSIHPEKLAETVLHRSGVRSNDRASDPDRPEDLARLLERLGPEHPVLFRNLTPTAVAQGPGDWYVLRVIVPGLQPMHGDHRLPFLGGPLWGPRSLADWSRMPPHPFP
jgi:ribosomal protein S12 methylthiotransferase accessory factor